MKEFLFTIKSEGVMPKQQLIPLVMSNISNWTQRVPNYAFDKISVWDDILTARTLVLDLYNFQLKDEFTCALGRNRDLADIRAILQV
jgi:hypothetical protein